MLTEIAPGHWKARIYVRDTSGRRRDVTRFSPVKLNSQGRVLPDRTGQRALDAVLSAAADIRVDLDDALSDSISVRELWEHYRDHLISLNRAGSTIDCYPFRLRQGARLCPLSPHLRHHHSFAGG